MRKNTNEFERIRPNFERIGENPEKFKRFCENPTESERISENQTESEIIRKEYEKIWENRRNS